MTEAILDSPARPAVPLIGEPIATADEALAVAPAQAVGTPASRIREYIRSGKFSPEVAAQLDRVMNADNSSSMALSPSAPPSDLYVIEMVSHMVTGCVLAVLVVGAVALCVSWSGIIDSYLMGVAALIFVFVLLGVVAVGALNQAPPKPRPPKPQKAAKPAKGKGAKAKAPKAEAEAATNSPALLPQ